MPAAVIVVSRRGFVVDPVRAVCQAHGLHVVVGVDAREALARARAYVGSGASPAGVIVDVEGAVFDGGDGGDDPGGDHDRGDAGQIAELCGALRSVPGLAEVPIVLLGTHGSPLSSLHAALDAGADAFFALPVEAGRVVAKLLAYGAAPDADGGAHPALASALVPAAAPPAPDEPRRPPFASAATPDELLAALESTDVVVGDYDDDDDDDDDPLVAASGRCAAGEVASLLWSLHVRRRSGVLELLDDAGVRRGCSFVDGVPTQVRSTVASEQPAAVLLRLGWVTAPRLAAAVGGAPPPPTLGALCTALVDAGGLLPEEQRDAARDALREQLGALVTLDDAAWQLREFDDDRADDDRADDDRADDDRADDDRAEQEHALPATAVFATMLVDTIRRRLDLPRLFAAVGGPKSVLVPVDRTERTDRGATMDVRAWQGALLEAETRALAAFDGARDLDAVVVDAGVERAVAWRAALLGRTFGALRTLHRAALPSPQGEHARRAREATIVRERVFDRLARARSADPLHLLSLTPDATPAEVAAAATALRARFDPARADVAGIGDLRDVLVEIVGAIDAAAASLLRRG